MFNSVKNKFVLAICKDKLIIHNNTGKDGELSVKSMINIPCMPFYNYLYEKNVEIEITGELSEKKKSFVKNNFLCVFPDDCIDVDKKIIEEYSYFKLNGKRVTDIYYSQLLNLDKGDYIAVGKTERCITLSLIKNYGIYKKLFIDKNSDMSEIAKAIDEIKTNTDILDVPVYINNINDDMSGFASLGEIVNADTILANCDVVLEKL